MLLDHEIDIWRSSTIRIATVLIMIRPATSIVSSPITTSITVSLHLYLHLLVLALLEESVMRIWTNIFQAVLPVLLHGHQSALQQRLN